MNTAIALSLDLLLHIRHVASNTGRIFTSSQAQILRKNLEGYINGKTSPSLNVLNSMWYMFRKQDLPYKITEPAVLPPTKVAVEFTGELLLLHYGKAGRAEWKHKFKGIKGSRVESYQYKDGGVLNFEFVPKNFDTISYLKVCGFDVYSTYKRANRLADIPSSALDKRLFPYQVDGVRMLQSGYRLLADEQGLGKTAQVLQFTNLHPEYRNILICCPATLKLNWKREVGMWTSFRADDVQVLSGGTPYPVTSKYAIINYDILPQWESYLSRVKWDLIVADECHYIQNDTAKRTQAFIKIAASSEDTIFISGTPFTSRPYQMYTALHSIAPSIFRNQHEYGMRFCDPKFEGMKWSFKGATNMDVLHGILKDGICIRRLKEDVLTELPDKMRIVVPVATDNADLRKDASTFSQIMELEHKIDSAKSVLGTLEWQKQIAYLRKKGEVSKWVAEFLQSGKKLVVFANHKMTLDDLESKFGRMCVRIDGEVSMKERDKAVTAFQTDPNVKLFLGNMRAAGVGLTLTAASDLLFTEFAWTSAEMIQSEDRIHRIGQKSSVNVYYMCCPGTIDDKLMDIVNHKAAVHKRIFDGTMEDNMLEILRKNGGCTYTPLFKGE